MDEYVIMNKSDLTTMADTIRETLGSTDSIAVGNLANKLVESIQAGGGGRRSENSFHGNNASVKYTESHF